MNKAFTREDSSHDDGGDDHDGPELPANFKNYITPRGVERLQQELFDLKTRERPEVTATVAWAASNGDRSENADYTYGKRRLREIDRRIRFLTKRLEAAEVVDPCKVASDVIRFGATVTIADEKGEERRYVIVGIDEADASKGRVSWVSPIASALMNAREGDVVTFRSPAGMRELEVLSIEYRTVEIEPFTPKGAYKAP